MGRENMLGKKNLADLMGKGNGEGQKGGSSVSLLSSTILILVTAMILLVAGAFYLVQNQQQVNSKELQVRASSEGIARNISNQIAIYKKLLEGLSKDPGVVAVLRKGAKPGLRALSADLKSRIPNAKYLRVLPPEWNDQETGIGPKLSFASLAMLRSVEKSRKISVAEVHQFNSKDQHIAIAAPVIMGGKGPVLGLLHLSLPMDMINQSVRGAGKDAGIINIRQVVSGSPLMLAANDTGMGRLRDQSGSININGSIWSVAYKPGVSSVIWSEHLVFYGLLLIGFGLVVITVLLITNRLKQALQSDQDMMVMLVERLLMGRVASSQKAKVKELQGTMDHLIHMMHGIKDHAATQSPEVAVISPKTGLPQASVEKALESAAEQSGGIFLPQTIFRSYDVRGVVGEDLTTDVVYQLGRAIGSVAYDEGEQTVIVARDGRKSGTELMDALSRGLMESGRDVVDIGVVPTPVLYFATNFLGTNSGVMLTGSHNPPEYNGLKIVIAGETLSGDRIKGLRQRISKGDLLQGEGGRSDQDIRADYVSRIAEDLHVARPLNVVLDCGNGVAGLVAPALLKMLGCNVTEMYCDVDGSFPNHHPDPSRPENLQDLISIVKSTKADIGIAMDGDGDRIGVIDSEGNIIWPDRLLMLFAIDLLIRQPGADIIYDVKSSRHLAGQILANGGRPLMWKSGHSLIKAKMKETGALLAGELSGHIFFKERWYGFDDALYACARLLEILASDPRSSAEIFADLPESISTPELSMRMKEGENVQLVNKLLESGEIQGAKLISIDGVRAEFEYGWGLIRASNTMPAVIFRFEAEDESGLQKVQEVFRQELLALDPNLELPF